MSFITYFPCDALKPFVKSFAVSQSEPAATYKVLPGTSIVMGFQFSGQLSYTQNGQQMPLKSAGITGLLDSYRLFTNSTNTGSVLVLFSETDAAAFFKQPLHELFGKSLPLDDLILSSQMDMVTSQLADTRTDAQRIAIVETFLLSRLSQTRSDELVRLAVHWIRQANGNLKIQALAAKLCISQGQLEKRFRKVVGASPKKFASLVRLSSLTEGGAGQSNLLGRALDAGYFDQAHFIKDFKSFTGSTPEQFFGKK